MAEITSELLEVTVDTDHTVEIDSKLPEVVVDIAKSITVEIQPENYVLTSGGMYTGNMTGAVPTWLLNAIQQQLTTGDGNVMSVLDAMQTLLNSVQLGVNQAISQIENTNVSMSALETSLGSRIGNNEAAILDVYATRVTAAEAQAIAATAIGTTFGGNVDAYIGNLASVYTAPGSATATNISTLQTSYNDQSARIDAIDYVAIDEFGYSLGASKLGTAPDGSIVGWQFTDGTGVQSEFKIQAEKFSISDGTTGYTPFLIDGTDIKFNGLVEFSNISGGESILTTGEAAADINANTTTIDGGKITTNSLNANTIIAGGSISSPNIYGGYINGGIIEGTQIIGSVIKGSFIDLTTTIYLTNWQSITDINTIPVEYRDNFAKDSATGDYIVDSEGYYRLPGTLNLNSPAYSYTNNITKAAQSFAIPGWVVPIYSYNSYMINTLNRVVTNAFTANYVSPGEVIGFKHNAFQLGFNCFWEYSSIFKVFDTTYELYCSFTTNDHADHMYNINAYVKINGVTQNWTTSTTDVIRKWAPSTFSKNGITYNIYFGFGYLGGVIMELSAYIQFQGTTLNVNNGFVSDQVIFEYLSGYITHGYTSDNSSSGNIIANFPVLQITPIF